MDLLTTNRQIREKIRWLLADAADERIVIVAFVGGDAAAYLPKARGIKLYCWLNPTGTNPNGLRRLQQRGVSLHVIEDLHVKLYWSHRRGAVLGSPNLSRSALADNALHELAVHLPPGSVDVHRLLARMNPTLLTADRLERFERRYNLYRMRNPRSLVGERNTRRRSFLEWSKARSPKWQLYGWTEMVESAPRDAIRHVVQQTGDAEYRDFITSDSKASYRVGEWILRYRDPSTPHKPPFAREFGWFIPEVPATTKVKAWRGSHYIWFQKSRHLPDPPFSLRDPAFVSAFNEALAAIGNDAAFDSRRGSAPSKALIDLIRKRYVANRSKKAA
jgi:hypothetical protein